MQGCYSGRLRAADIEVLPIVERCSHELKRFGRIINDHIDIAYFAGMMEKDRKMDDDIDRIVNDAAGGKARRRRIDARDTINNKMVAVQAMVIEGIDISFVAAAIVENGKPGIVKGLRAADIVPGLPSVASHEKSGLRRIAHAFLNEDDLIAGNADMTGRRKRRQQKFLP